MLRLEPVTEDILRGKCQGVMSEIQALEPDINLRNRDKNKESKSESHVRYYIKLENDVPVINTLTCGQQYIKAAKVLGISKSQLEEIADFRTVWDKDKECLISVEQASNPLYNGAAVLKLIENMTPVDDIEAVLSLIVKKALPTGYVGKVQRRRQGWRKLYSDWTVHVESQDKEEIPPMVYSQIDQSITRCMGNGTLSRVNMLINILNAFGYDEDKMKQYLANALVVRYVVVIPYTMRPALDGRRHPMTQIYARLFQANTEVYMYKNGRQDDFKEHYRKIAQMVQSIMTENMFAKSDLKSLDPVLKRIKGKNGMIRATMLKKRQDYSGRSAVIVNPFLPVNRISLPKTMAVKLFRRYLTSDCGVPVNQVMEKINDPDFIEQAVKLLKKHGIFDEVPLLLGRNPTLHKHGIQGFYCEVNDGRAIQVNPLPCPAFNMDFDGDAAHTEVTITPLALYEIRKLIMTDKNIILPKTGNCTICPEKDVVYGLYMSTYNYGQSSNGGTYANAAELKEALYNQVCYVWDNVSVGNLGSGRAGWLAFLSCFPAKIAKQFPDEPVTQSVIKKYIRQMQNMPTETFDNCVNSLVELGMKIAYLYNKSVSVLAPLNANEEFDHAIEKFNKEMEEIYELSDFGFYDQDSFGYDFSNKISEVDKSLKKNILAKMPDNMFKTMAVSGARGSEGNLVQMFGAKGRIQKSESETFNVLIGNSMQEQLTPMDQSISAHGARRGQISKSIKTADTGYLSRKLNHVAGPIVITEADCGTREGVTISFEDIKSWYITDTTTAEDMPVVESKAEETMVHFIQGRYRTSNNIKIGMDEAVQIARSHKEVKIRSVLTCENPCCAKCYGTYVETGKLPPVGFPVGFIAASAMSEPSTQLVMKEFQLGGVARAASPFDRLAAILSMTQIRNKASLGEYPTYDPVAWAPGVLRSEPYNGYANLLYIDPVGEPQPGYDYKLGRIVPSNALCKLGQEVKPGDMLRVSHGDCYIPEMLKYGGLERAWLTMIYSLYFLFKSQVDLLPIHLEVVVSACTGYVPKISNSPKLKLGKYYTKRLLVDIGEDLVSNQMIPDIRGVDNIVLGSPNFMEGFIMEDQREALSEAVLNCLYDTDKSPLVQLALGQRVKVGTGYSSTFLEDMG